MISLREQSNLIPGGGECSRVCLLLPGMGFQGSLGDQKAGRSESLRKEMARHVRETKIQSSIAWAGCNQPPLYKMTGAPLPHSTGPLGLGGLRAFVGWVFLSEMWGQ